MSKPILHPVKKILTGGVGALGISFLIILGVDAQQPLGNNSVAPIRPITPNNSINSINRVNTNSITPTQDGKVVGDRNAYPYGSRIGTNGVISTPQGENHLPGVTINHGDGSKSYYYRDGSRVDVNSNTIPPTGKLLRQ